MIKKIFKLINKFRIPVNWYNLRRLEPISRVFGFDRGTPIDRKYIQGVICEIAGGTYSKKYGSNVKSYEIFYYTNNNPKVIIVGILTDINTLSKNKIDVLF
ncbi:hypothetical protein [Sulfurihydrogenibium yellowstonense]|uniref:Glycosyl transferase family 2 n=1 Tax=Sulfurihydrogenibium yellowstonense SS-5 TaxID=432331 RepID=C4FIS1_9AQUI|nr:hypothetical protein [Sulfurihydrogenibium yellowstonense]EEP61037.1 glycosyl transferase family 2 [Sulfurihydrogenibium yellowstonense SS-5]